MKGLASHFVWLNRSKESLTLDLKRPEARRRAAAPDRARRRVAAQPRARRDGPARLRRRLRCTSSIRGWSICEISGYGTTGPYRDKKAYDLLVQSEAGLVSITGTPETPSKVGISIADIAGGMYAFSGILAALLRARREPATGAVLDVSMFDALAEWMGYPGVLHRLRRHAAAAHRRGHAAIAPYGPYTAGDGKVVYLGLQNEREWARFCAEVLGQPALASTIRDSARTRIAWRTATRLDALITAAFATLTAEEVLARLDAAQIANARMNTVAGVPRAPTTRGARPLAHGRVAGRPDPRAAAAVRTSDDVEPRMEPIPAVGEHTDAILGELGYDAGVVEEWRRAGIV